MSIDLFEHNRQAYDSACEMLSVTGKACVVPPHRNWQVLYRLQALRGQSRKNRLLALPPSIIYSEHSLKTLLLQQTVISLKISAFLPMPS